MDTQVFMDQCWAQIKIGRCTGTLVMVDGDARSGVIDA